MIFLIVNNKKHEKFQNCPVALPNKSSEGVPVCNEPGTEDPVEDPLPLINPADYILYFYRRRYYECEITTRVSEIFDAHFSYRLAWTYGIKGHNK